MIVMRLNHLFPSVAPLDNSNNFAPFTMLPFVFCIIRKKSVALHFAIALISLLFAKKAYCIAAMFMFIEMTFESLQCTVAIISRNNITSR